jgi:pimeloyl-ACP methyl ester carboxylesterase
LSTYVLVHGAWGGGWYWKKLLPLLRAEGHLVHAPTLTGLGERIHLASPEIGLGTHIEDVVNQLVFEDLADVILVGHSYGGMVITGVAEQAPERLSNLVYLDAFVPENGQAQIDLMPPERRRAFRDQAEAEGDGWRIPRFGPSPWEQVVREIFHVRDDGDIAWLASRFTPQPLKTMTEPVRCSDGIAGGIPRTFIRCASYDPSPFAQFGERYRHPESGWRYRELATWHMCMVTMPSELSKVLLELAM